MDALSSCAIGFLTEFELIPAKAGPQRRKATSKTNKQRASPYNIESRTVKPSASSGNSSVSPPSTPEPSTPVIHEPARTLASPVASPTTPCTDTPTSPPACLLLHAAHSAPATSPTVDYDAMLAQLDSLTSTLSDCQDLLQPELSAPTTTKPTPPAPTTVQPPTPPTMHTNPLAFAQLPTPATMTSNPLARSSAADLALLALLPTRIPSAPLSAMSKIPRRPSASPSTSTARPLTTATPTMATRTHLPPTKIPQAPAVTTRIPRRPVTPPTTHPSMAPVAAVTLTSPSSPSPALRPVAPSTPAINNKRRTKSCRSLAAPRLARTTSARA